jgi:putative nucleotidyltransferase with HDIG domain
MTSRLSVGLARGLVFAVGILAVGGVCWQLGFGVTEAAIIAGLAAILCALATQLAWGGFLFPGDALLICLGLLSGRQEIAIAAIGFAIASGSVLSGWGRATAVGTLRNPLAVLCAVAIWRNLAPAWTVILEGGRALRLPGVSIGGWFLSTRAIPAILLTTLTYFVIASVIETLVRERREYPFGEYWLLNFGKNFHHLFFTMVLGAVAAVGYRDVGATALVLFAVPIVLTRDALKRSLDLRTSRMEALKALSSSVDARDRYTYDHSNRVSRLACMLAREMGFGEATVEVIEGGALLHDIGKLSVDAEILSKPGPLDVDERAAIQEHPRYSADVLGQVDLLKDSVDIVRHHHERPDGTGYPDGLSGHEIPVGSRILNVADAFDAMISDRPYRKRRTLDEALEELRRGAGTEFDPVVVEYLARLIGRGELENLGFELN